MKRIIYPIMVFATLLVTILSHPVDALDTSVDRWEYYNLYSDTQYEVQYSSWSAQTFTTGATESYWVDYVRIKLIDLGSNTGMLTLSLQAVNASGAPNGEDLCSGTLSATEVGTTAGWFMFDFDDQLIESNTTYALVLRNTGIDIGWSMDGSSSNYSGGSEWLSTDGGVLWAADTDDDYMFEVWGMSALQISDAEVYNTFANTGDWLIVAKCLNEFSPYSPYYNPKDYFTVQLLAEGSLLAQVPLAQWSMQPVSIYLNPTSVESLEWGNTTYTLRLNGSFTNNPNVSCNLTWIGTDLNSLDSWCLLFAGEMGEYYGEALTVKMAEKGMVLTQEAGVVFTLGIPGLQYIRPNIFKVVSTAPIWDDENYSYGYAEHLDDWESIYGTEISGAFNNASTTFFGGVLSGKNLFAIIVFAIFVIFSGGAFITGHPVAGLLLGSPALIAGVLTGLIPVVAFFAICAILVLLAVWNIWWSKT